MILASVVLSSQPPVMHTRTAATITALIVARPGPLASRLRIRSSLLVGRARRSRRDQSLAENSGAFIGSRTRA
jgi:hypothetical protein